MKKQITIENLPEGTKVRLHEFIEDDFRLPEINATILEYQPRGQVFTIEDENEDIMEITIEQIKKIL